MGAETKAPGPKHQRPGPKAPPTPLPALVSVPRLPSTCHARVLMPSICSALLCIAALHARLSWLRRTAMCCDLLCCMGSGSTPPGSSAESSPGSSAESPPGSSTESPPGRSTESSPGSSTESPPGSSAESPPGGCTESPPGGCMESPPGSSTESPPGGCTESAQGWQLRRPWSAGRCPCMPGLPAAPMRVTLELLACTAGLGMPTLEPCACGSPLNPVRALRALGCPPLNPVLAGHP
jgi:hypothetical protein